MMPTVARTWDTCGVVPPPRPVVHHGPFNARGAAPVPRASRGRAGEPRGPSPRGSARGPRARAARRLGPAGVTTATCTVPGGRARPQVGAGHPRGRQADIRAEARPHAGGHRRGDVGVDSTAFGEQLRIHAEQRVLEVGGVRHHTTAQHAGRPWHVHQAGAHGAAGQRLGDGERPAARLERRQELGREPTGWLPAGRRVGHLSCAPARRQGAPDRGSCSAAQAPGGSGRCPSAPRRGRPHGARPGPRSARSPAR